jgi:thioredoxin reductase
MNLDVRHINTGFLIIGGSTAGCSAALAFCEYSNSRVLIVEKADIRRMASRSPFNLTGRRIFPEAVC